MPFFSHLPQSTALSCCVPESNLFAVLKRPNSRHLSSQDNCSRDDDYPGAPDCAPVHIVQSDSGSGCWLDTLLTPVPPLLWPPLDRAAPQPQTICFVLALTPSIQNQRNLIWSFKLQLPSMIRAGIKPSLFRATSSTLDHRRLMYMSVMAHGIFFCVNPHFFSSGLRKGSSNWLSLAHKGKQS